MADFIPDRTRPRNESDMPDPVGSEFTNLRRWPRYNFDLPVRVVLARGTHEVRVSGRGTAINEGGLAVDVDASLQVGKSLHVEFVPPYCMLPLRVPGTVRNARGNRYGVEFVSTDAGGEQEIELFRDILRTAAHRLH